MSDVPEHVLEWHKLIREALPEPYELEILEGGVVPMVKIPPDFDSMYRFLKQIFPKLPGVGGGRMFREGIVLEPRKPREAKPGWPYDEPETVERYGL